MTRSEILKILKKYKDENAKKYGINKIGLFGSYSRNKANNESDIDIIIETIDPDIFKLVHIKEDLEHEFKKSIDIVRKRENMNPYLKKHIEKDAIYV
ncbi:MAG: nucleotidyltransferase domain-containing protein [Spirochaetes bacterium]|nr:nucleotidyltransferase domain-containing protein [Spirochaetota bacterium]